MNCRIIQALVALEQERELTTIRVDWGGRSKDVINAFFRGLLYSELIKWGEWKEEDYRQMFMESRLPFSFLYELGHTGRGYEDLEQVELSAPMPNSSGETHLLIADFTRQIAQALEGYSESRFATEDEDYPLKLDLEREARLLRLVADTVVERELVICFLEPSEARPRILWSIGVLKEASEPAPITKDT